MKMGVEYLTFLMNYVLLWWLTEKIGKFQPVTLNLSSCIKSNSHDIFQLFEELKVTGSYIFHLFRAFKVTGNYIFQLFRAFKVTGNYIFQLL